MALTNGIYSKMKNMEFRFFRFLFLLFLLGWSVSDARAQDVPSAIKYQAVLRDLNGNVLADEENVDIRISIRLDNAVSGTIAFQEEHLGLKTNAFGLIHLEMGRGIRISANGLSEVPWGGHTLFVQLEMQLDGSGYTNMGYSELLSVPYAFMAGNADISGLLENLEDGALPMYNRMGNNLVNSGVRKDGTTLEVEAASVTFSDPASSRPGYTFPMEAGRKGQILVLQDNKGTLAWDTVAGGGGIGGDASLDLGVGDDGRLLYWNDPDGEVRSAPLVYEYGDGNRFRLEGVFFTEDSLIVAGSSDLHGNARIGGMLQVGGGLEVGGLSRFSDSAYFGQSVLVEENLDVNGGLAVGGEARVGGTLEVGSDMSVGGNVSVDADLRAKALSADSLAVKLPAANIWVGDASGINQARPVQGHVLMDETGTTRLNLYIDEGLELKDGQDMGPDTLRIVRAGVSSAGGDSLWMQNASDPDLLYAFNKNRPLSDTKVGIGLSDPKAMFQVESGDVLFSSRDGVSKDSLCFYWDHSSAALRAGGIRSGSSAWNVRGKYSLAMGLDARAEADNSMAFGQDASVEVSAVGSAAVGNSASVQGENSFALGRNATVTQPEAVAFGTDASAQGRYSFAMGRSSAVLADYALAFGYQAKASGVSSLSIGKNSVAAAENAISLGQNTVNASGAMAVGNNNTNDLDALAFGMSNTVGKGAIALGSGNSVGENSIYVGSKMNVPFTNSIAIGGVLASPSFTSITNYNGPIVVGTASTGSNLVSLGRRNSDASSMGNVLMVGSDMGNDAGYSNLTMMGEAFNSSDFTGNGSDPLFLLGSSYGYDPGLSIMMGVDLNMDVFFSGTVHCFGLDQSSDYRLKTDIVPVSCSLALFDSLQPVSYRFKKDRQERRHLGFIAQEVRRYLPVLVSERADGMLGMDYIGLVPVLWDLGRQMNGQISDLRKKLAEKEQKIVDLERELDEQSARMRNIEAELAAVREKLGIE